MLKRIRPLPLLLLLLAATLGLAACRDEPPNYAPAVATETREGGLVIEDVIIGTGQEAGPGSAVRIEYVGRLESGKIFDASSRRGIPYSFQVGRGMAIRGMDEGVQGMRVGGKRRLRIPPALGYGDKKVAGIPPNSTLIFEIELVSATAPTMPRVTATPAPAGS
jgi:FKBP-type peptidyl-prolyl cis-trans isomerase